MRQSHVVITVRHLLFTSSMQTITLSNVMIGTSACIESFISGFLASRGITFYLETREGATTALVVNGEEDKVWQAKDLLVKKLGNLYPEIGFYDWKEEATLPSSGIVVVRSAPADRNNETPSATGIPLIFQKMLSARFKQLARSTSGIIQAAAPVIMETAQIAGEFNQFLAQARIVGSGLGNYAMLTYKHQNLLLNTRPDKDFSALVDHVKQAFGIPESSPISIFKKVDGKGMFQITDILSLNETQQFYATDSDAFEEG